MRLEAAILSDILHLVGQGNSIFIREKSGNFEKLCPRQPCTYHVESLHVKELLCHG